MPTCRISESIWSKEEKLLAVMQVVAALQQPGRNLHVSVRRHDLVNESYMDISLGKRPYRPWLKDIRLGLLKKQVNNPISSGSRDNPLGCHSPAIDTIDIALKFLEEFKVVSLENKRCDVESEIHAKDVSICVKHHARAQDSGTKR